MPLSRRDWFRMTALGLAASPFGRMLDVEAHGSMSANPPLTITGLKVTPIALPDPPLLNAGGCHGPYFLRNVVELTTDAGIVGLGETVGGQQVTSALEKARGAILGKSVFAYRG